MCYRFGGQEYTFSSNALKDDETRTSYFQLADEIYGLKFEEWYQSGYWDECFIPYVMLHDGTVVSSVSVCINDITWNGEQKRYVQISTVMTVPAYREKGLNRLLMETVLIEWKDKCDAVYLLANDSVVNFYPKFGFEKFVEYQYSIPIIPSNGTYRKLDIENHDDWKLIIQKYKVGNPFTSLAVNNISLFVFACLQSLSNHIYYIHESETVVIAKYDDEKLICYDIFTGNDCQLNDILSIMATENTKVAFLGFTPKSIENCTIEESQEEDTHLFVLVGKENIFKHNKVMFPLLSRA